MPKIHIDQTVKANLISIVTKKVAEMQKKAYSYYSLSGDTLNAFQQLCHIHALELAIDKQKKSELNATHQAYYAKCEQYKALKGHLDFHFVAGAGSKGDFSSLMGAERVLIKPVEQYDDSHCVMLTFENYNKVFLTTLRRQVAALIENTLLIEYDLLPQQAKRCATKVGTQNNINWNAYQNEVEFKTTGGKYALPEERQAYFDRKFLIC